MEKISIIIPTYNRKEYLKECIDSILEQTYKNLEIIVVDDCSEDGTHDFILENYKDDRIIYLKNETNSGASVSRKNGYKIAKGKYVIFCDDDDYYTDNKFFEEGVKALKNDNIILVCSNSYIKYETENTFKLWKINFENMIEAKDYLKNFQTKYIKPNSTFSTIFRKSILDKSDVENMQMMNDSSIYLRAIINNGKIFVYESPIGVYRMHSKNITFNLSADFIIENLNEKKYIYEKILQENIIENSSKCFEEQILLTIRYFIKGSNPNKKELQKILNWIKANFKKYNKVNLKIIAFFLKRKLTVW